MTTLYNSLIIEVESMILQNETNRARMEQEMQERSKMFERQFNLIEEDHKKQNDSASELPKSENPALKYLTEGFEKEKK